MSVLLILFAIGHCATIPGQAMQRISQRSKEINSQEFTDRRKLQLDDGSGRRHEEVEVISAPTLGMASFVSNSPTFSDQCQFSYDGATYTCEDCDCEAFKGLVGLEDRRNLRLSSMSASASANNEKSTLVKMLKEMNSQAFADRRSLMENALLSARATLVASFVPNSPTFSDQCQFSYDGATYTCEDCDCEGFKRLVGLEDRRNLQSSSMSASASANNEKSTLVKMLKEMNSQAFADRRSLENGFPSMSEPVIYATAGPQRLASLTPSQCQVSIEGATYSCVDCDCEAFRNFF